MIKRYKNLMILSMILMICIVMTACGGKKEASTTAQKEYVYVPEYKEMPDSSQVSSIAFSNNTIYYFTWEYDEKTEVQTSAVKTMDIKSGESKVLPIELGENDSVSNIQVDNEGNLLLLIYSYVQKENQDDFSQNFLLKKVDKDGKVLSDYDLNPIMSKEENSYIQYFLSDNEGNIYLSNGDSKIWILDQKGNEICSIDLDDYVSSMGTTKEGKVVVSMYDQDKIVLREVDLASKGLGATYENVPNPNGNLEIMKGIDKGCLINSNNSLFEYDLDSQSSNEILNWIDCDINSDNIVAVSTLDDGRIFVLTTDYSQQDGKTEMVYLTKTKSSQVAEKEILTYGCLYTGQNVRKSIINFNKTNEKYRIELKEYGSDDYEAGVAQFNSDIASGNSPDIIDLSTGNVSAYIEKGVLEDLYPYLEKDADINKDDFIESALKAYESDGKLYAILPSFSISTIIGKTSEVGDKMGWKLDQLMDYVKSKPEGTEVFDYATKESILSSLCLYEMDQFIDWKTGKCSFNSDEFVKILEFSNTFSSDKDYVYDDNAPSTASKIRDGKLLLTMTTIGDVQSYQMNEAMYGEPITFIGYPTESGTGSAISPGEVAFGISSKSKNKAGAWEFVKGFFNSDYQNSEGLWGFPILKSALDNKFKEAMTPKYSEDENGNQVEQIKSSWGYEDANFDIYAAKQEEVDAVKKLIDSADSVYQYNNEVYKIISEETAPFFEGQKKAKDVADVIQSRVQIYVNENR